LIGISARAGTKHRNEVRLDPVTFRPGSGRGVSLANRDYPVSGETGQKDGDPVNGIKLLTRIINIHDGRKLSEIMVEETRASIPV